MATTKWAAWNWIPPRARKRLKRRQKGFALYGAARRPGLPTPLENAHGRFEHEARVALRDWLLL